MSPVTRTQSKPQKPKILVFCSTFGCPLINGAALDNGPPPGTPYLRQCVYPHNSDQQPHAAIFLWSERHRYVICCSPSFTSLHYIKSKSQMCRPWRHTGGVEVQLHAFLTLALDRSKLSATHPSVFATAKSAPGTQWIRGWVDPSSILEVLQKQNISYPFRKSNHDSSVVQLVV